MKILLLNQAFKNVAESLGTGGGGTSTGALVLAVLKLASF